MRDDKLINNNKPCIVLQDSYNLEFSIIEAADIHNKNIDIDWGDWDDEFATITVYVDAYVYSIV